MSRTWPVEIETDETVACGAVLWRHRGRQTLTVIVKASFSLVHGGPMLHGGPAEIAREDRLSDRSPARSLESASDLAPYLARCDVLFRGHAYAQKGQPAPAGAARLAVFRAARPLLDKTIHVFAQPGGPGAARQALPRPVYSAADGAAGLFSRMPIVYERAFGGPDVPANPAGVKEPNLVDPADPRRPIGFGPIAPHWPARRLAVARGPEAGALPDDLEWSSLQAAPLDQQIEHLTGGEWLVLDGLHPVLARLQTQVPAARGAARVVSRDPSGRGPSGLTEAPVELVADTLSIDGDAHQCTITWRGQVPIPGSAGSLSGMVVLAGLESPDRPVPWARLAAQAAEHLLAPAPAPAAQAKGASAAAAAPAPDEGPRSGKHRTMALSAEHHEAVASASPMPFVAGPPSVRVPGTPFEAPAGLGAPRPPEARPSSPRKDATPWGPPSVRSVPVASVPVAGAGPVTVTLSSSMFGEAPVAPPPVSPPPEPVVPRPPEPASAPPPDPPAAIAVAPPPLVGPIQAPIAAAPPEKGAASAAAPSSKDALAPPPRRPNVPELPAKLGKGNLAAADVASFLRAFDLPPGSTKP